MLANVQCPCARGDGNGLTICKEERSSSRQRLGQQHKRVRVRGEKGLVSIVGTTEPIEGPQSCPVLDRYVWTRVHCHQAHEKMKNVPSLLRCPTSVGIVPRSKLSSRANVTIPLYLCKDAHMCVCVYHSKRAKFQVRVLDTISWSICNTMPTIL